MNYKTKRILFAAILMIFALKTGYGPSETELTNINVMPVNDNDFYEYIMEDKIV